MQVVISYVRPRPDASLDNLNENSVIRDSAYKYLQFTLEIETRISSDRRGGFMINS